MDVICCNCGLVSGPTVVQFQQKSDPAKSRSGRILGVGYPNPVSGRKSISVHPYFVPTWHPQMWWMNREITGSRLPRSARRQCQTQLSEHHAWTSLTSCSPCWTDSGLYKICVLLTGTNGKLHRWTDAHVLSHRRRTTLWNYAHGLNPLMIAFYSYSLETS